jgi:hypothetical protein
MNISERLKKLNPFVVGIRFSNMLPVIDCIFNEQWVLNNTDSIHFVKSGDSGEYMYYSESPDVTIDNLLDFVEKIINFNLDEEVKVKLFRIKLNELKEIFENNSLSQVKKLVFSFNEINQPTQIGGKFDLTNEGLGVDLKITHKENNYKGLNTVKEQHHPVKLDVNNAEGETKKIEPVCRCKGSERCSVCLGIEI